MKHFLATTAIAVLAANAAPAQTAENAGAFIDVGATGDIYGTDLIGKRLYVDENEFDASAPTTEEARAEWDDVGEIADLLISSEGQVKAAILDIGGFLGIGERRVAVDMGQLNFLRDNDDPDEVFVTVTVAQEELQDAPEFQPADEAMAVPETMDTTESVADPATDSAADPAAPSDSMALTRPMVEREGYMRAEPEALTAERLDGATVYGQEDESVGSISELVLDDAGAINQVVIDVGGFLGMGTHPVAVGFDQLEIIQNEGGDDLRVYIEASKEKLEALPAYEG